MRRLLAWLLGDDDRRAFESEQAELYAARRRQIGAKGAGRRRWSDRVILVTRLLVERGRREPEDGPSLGPVEHLRNIWRDLRQSARSLARTPWLAATIVLTVGLGLGATAAMVSVIHAVLLDPLPYRDADNLLIIRTQYGENLFPLSVVDYQAIDAQQRTLASVAVYRVGSATVIADGVARRERVREVTPGYFGLLGLKPVAGRLFDAGDGSHGPGPVVLSASYWQRRFNGQAAVVGSTIQIDGEPHVVVGVLAQTSGPLEHDVAFYQRAGWPTPTRKGPFFLTVLARLRDGVSRETGQAELGAISRRLFPIWRSSYQDEKATWALGDFKTRVVGSSGPTLWLLMAGVAGVLLVACTNAANLVVARAIHRQRELAIRSALGASRARLTRDLLVEASVLMVLAAGLGVAIAAGGIRLVALYGESYIPRIDEIRLAGPALVWLGVLTAASAIAIGWLPTLVSLRGGQQGLVGAGTRSVTDGPAARRTRRALVIAEFAVATPLVIAAGLVIASLQQLMRVDVGMDTRHVLTAQVSLPQGQYASPASLHAFWEHTRDRLQAMAGVEAVAFADSRPPQEASNYNNFDLEDHPTPQNEHQPVCPWIAVTPEFFRATGLTLVRGRYLDTHDFVDNAASVVLVDRVWARRFFGTEDVVGRRLREGGCTQCAFTTVVGVVGTVKYLGLERTDEGTVYQPLSDNRQRFVMIRSAGVAASLAPTVFETLHAIDPGVAVSGVATIGDLVATAMDTPRYLSVLIAAFALTALALSVVGIYGVMTNFVARHTRDIGIRLALGGSPGRIARMVILSGLRLVSVGVIAGCVAAALLAHLMSSLVFGVTTTDPTTFVAVPLVMLAVAVIACTAPARRAMKTTIVMTE